VFVSFDHAGYKLDVRVFSNITSTLCEAQTISPAHRTDHGHKSDDAVAQLYGPSIVPGLRLDGGADDPNGWGPTTHLNSRFRCPVFR
jgi:hypothetical protein